MTDTVTDNKKDIKKEDKKQAFLREIEEMYRAGVHFGYSRSLKHSKMQPFFLGSKNGAEIFHLEKVYPLFNNALDFVKELGAKRAKILFVATKPEATDIIEKAGRDLNMSYVTERWLGGTLTNFEIIKKRIDFFRDLKDKKSTTDFSGMTKKEKGRLEKQLLKMESRFGGLVALTEIPRALVVVDSKKEEIAVEEAHGLKIPIIAILNSDCDPTAVDYPIPANDTAVLSIEYLIDKLVKAYKEGMKGTKIEK